MFPADKIVKFGNNEEVLCSEGEKKKRKALGVVEHIENSH